MIRKQVYLRREHDRKVKSLAARRGCTEAEVIREAIECLPDPHGDYIARLEAAGILAPRPHYPDLPTGAELRALRAEFEHWFATRKEPLGLSQAILEDREGP